jgi:hypothetical protein
MPKDPDPLMDLYNPQATFELEGIVTPSPVKVLPLTVEGYGLYSKRNEVGGTTYYTDQYGCASEIWDTAVDNIVSVFAALDDQGEGETLWRHLAVVYGYTL